ncbi:MAG TPA: hypothetical protein VGX25_06760 [Actinophytocola sp.]|uniref:HNH endonuclease n=1 Tax=Actinophytocola sp. TaxID=1872138 RepID=UPI002DDCC966|nr:hypothetical protein [Actinophytocola sp.]HEV2779089.1 hypothetical protein [Actinophytocola sp.]
MVWLRKNDIGYDDPLVLAVGNAAYGALVRMEQFASAQRTNGWVPDRKAREIAKPAELKALLTVFPDLGAMLHRHGDQCPCLGQHDWSADRGGFWVHEFLRDNPSRAENDVHRAKRRELKDKELRAAVKRRDGDRCRYCAITVRWADRKTSQGGVLDHVDPRKAEGARNLVVACRGCNSRKLDCTPEAAGMVLLPPPGSTSRSTPDQPPIYAGSTDPTQIRPESSADPDPDPLPDEEPDPLSSQATARGSSMPETTPINGGINTGTTVGTGRAGAGTGSVIDAGDAGPAGHRPTVGPATTPRDALNPSPYFRFGTYHAGLPPPDPPGDPP